MDSPTNISPERLPLPAEPTVAGLYRQYQVLSNLFLITLIALVILSLGVNVYFYKSMKFVGLQLRMEQLSYQMSVRGKSDFETKTEPIIHNFMLKLQDYAATHPNLTPILERYRPILGPYMRAPGNLPATPSTPSQPPQPERK